MSDDNRPRIVETKVRQRGELSRRYAGNRKLRAEKGPLLSRTRHELTPWPGEVRCRPKRGRWRPGDAGPCGLYLGDMRNDLDREWYFVPAGPVRLEGDTVIYEGIPAPVKGEWRVRHDRVKQPTWIPIADRQLDIHCPRCGYVAPLQTLTTASPSI